MTERLPYSIPSVAEIYAAPRNGLTVLSTFTGAGGSCLGFTWAGYRTVAACEFVEAARDTYQANFPDVPIYPGDVRDVTGTELLALAGVDHVDVLEGAPPCASFSMAGRRSEGWGQIRHYSDTAQRVDDLFDEYLRLVGEIQPRAFVAENVAGMIRGVSKGYFRQTLAAARALGYRVAARLLDAQWLGVPQRRQRVIIVGIRDDVDRDPAFPDPFSYRYSLADALPWLDTAGPTRQRPNGRTRWGVDLPSPAVAADGMSTYAQHQIEVTQRGGEPVSIDEPSPTVMTHGRLGTRSELGVRVVDGMGSHFTERHISVDDPAPTIQAQLQGRTGIRVVGGPGAPHGNKGRDYDIDEPVTTIATPSHHFYVEGDGPSIDGYAIAREYDRLGPGESSDKYLNLVRPDPDAPCPTVTQLGGANAGVASVVHPTERRKLTIAELRRLCGFPDDFVLTGTYAQQWERCGRAVPPPMMRAVAAALVPVLAD